MSSRCNSNFATERIVKMCHGQKECRLAVNSEVLGNTHCPANVVTYAKVVHTCVSEKAIKGAHLLYVQSQRTSSAKHLAKIGGSDNKNKTQPLVTNTSGMIAVKNTENSPAIVNSMADTTHTSFNSPENNQQQQQAGSSEQNKTNYDKIPVTVELHLDSMVSGNGVPSNELGSPMGDLGDVQANSIGEQGATKHDNVLNNYIAAASRFDQNSVINLSANLTTTSQSGDSPPKYTTVDDLIVNSNNIKNNKYRALDGRNNPNFFTWLSDWWRDNTQYAFGDITMKEKATNVKEVRQSDLQLFLSNGELDFPFIHSL